ncbi:lipopolysaccharide biosynthesis protein [Kineosporia sp. J2-2]|uniref:Lipopolysaccharide biosynthesis protein n=1 Tax=Kineosporia corallincola TaxID=2835133 RepID=A0ABS5TEE0_9ACTN|nr:lipopolysaccharide biosynthesis protein [Kineosporia corallincola]MBT0769460.1 lipopolysaccharide biosynthesis protein [Kineosporia corallincola]
MNGRVYRNIGWNGLFLLVQTALALAVVPLLLHGVGEAGFGVYSFFLALLAASTLIQAGLDLAMSRSVARFRGDGDRDRLHAELSFGYAFALVAGFVEAGTVLGLTHFTSLVNEQNTAVTGALSLVFAASLIITGPLSVALAVLSGLERFMIRNTIQILPVAAGLVAALALQIWDAGELGIVVYAASVEITRVLAYLGNLFWVNRLLPHLSGLAARGLYRRDVIAFQAKQLGNQLADYLFYTSDRLILQGVAGAVVVAHYAIAERPNTLAQAVISTPLVAIVPSMVTALASGDRDYLRRMLTSGTRLYLWVTLPVLMAMLVSAPDLITLWVGEGYDDSARIAQVFVICMLAAGPFKIYSHYRLAEGTNGFMTVAKLSFAPLNAVTSYFLAVQWGLIGVVVPTAVFYAVIYPGLWIASMIRRGELLPYARTCARPMLAACLSLVVMASLEALLSGPGLLAAVGTAGLNVVLSLLIFAFAGGGLRALRTRADVNVVEIPDPSPVKV